MSTKLNAITQDDELSGKL